MNTGTPTVSAFPLVDPGPDTLVMPVRRLRDGISVQDASRFGQLRWELAELDQGDTTRSRAFLWSNFPSAIRASFMRISWALINIPTPDVLQHRLGSRSRPVLSMHSLMTTLTYYRHFARWLDRQQVTSLRQIDQGLLARYADHLGEKGWTDPDDERRLFAISRIWAYAPFLLPEDQLVMPPWEDPGTAIIDFLGDGFRKESGENREVVIHPSTMSPLLVWSLRVVLDLAPDISAAYREWKALTARIVPPGSAVPGAGASVRTYLEELKSSGGAVPTYIGSAGQYVLQNRKQAAFRPAIAVAHLAGTVGVTIQQAEGALAQLPPDLGGIAFADGAPLTVEVTGRIDGRPWIAVIDFTQAQQLAVHLMTAALIVIGYLSGMRPDEKGAELRLMQHSAGWANSIFAGRRGRLRGRQVGADRSASTSCARPMSSQQCCI